MCGKVYFLTLIPYGVVLKNSQKKKKRNNAKKKKKEIKMFQRAGGGPGPERGCLRSMCAVSAARAIMTGVLSTGSTLNPAVAEEQPPPEHEHDDHA